MAGLDPCKSKFKVNCAKPKPAASVTHIAKPAPVLVAKPNEVKTPTDSYKAPEGERANDAFIAQIPSEKPGKTDKVMSIQKVDGASGSEYVFTVRGEKEGTTRTVTYSELEKRIGEDKAQGFVALALGNLSKLVGGYESDLKARGEIAEGMKTLLTGSKDWSISIRQLETLNRRINETEEQFISLGLLDKKTSVFMDEAQKIVKEKETASLREQRDDLIVKYSNAVGTTENKQIEEQLTALGKAHPEILENEKLIEQTNLTDYASLLEKRDELIVRFTETDDDPVEQARVESGLMEVGRQIATLEKLIGITNDSNSVETESGNTPIEKPKSEKSDAGVADDFDK